MTLKELLLALTSLIFPPFCLSCGCLSQVNQTLCFFCESQLIETDHFSRTHNAVIDRLGLRAIITWGAALYIYRKDTPIQKMIHQLKYRGNFKIGINLGHSFGKHYSQSSHVERADFIIPIPVNKKRLRKRGYNQSMMFAEGISVTTGIPIVSRVLLSLRQRVTQTQKSRLDRFVNIKNSFKLVNESILENKRILLVDDVMTTGATLEAAIELLNSVRGISIQVGLMALAEN